MAEKSFIQRIKSIRACARFTAYFHFMVHAVTLSGFWFDYIMSWSEEPSNSKSGTVIAFDELFATLLICYSSYVLKEATFKYNLWSIRLWLEINGIYFLVSICLKYTVFVLRNPIIERKYLIISILRALWEMKALFVVYQFYKDQKTRSGLEHLVKSAMQTRVDNNLSLGKQTTMDQMQPGSISDP